MPLFGGAAAAAQMYGTGAAYMPPALLLQQPGIVVGACGKFGPSMVDQYALHQHHNHQLKPINYVYNSASPLPLVVTANYTQPIPNYTDGISDPLSPASCGVLAVMESLAQFGAPLANTNEPLAPVMSTAEFNAMVTPYYNGLQMAYPLSDPTYMKQYATNFGMAALMPQGYGY